MHGEIITKVLFLFTKVNIVVQCGMYGRITQPTKVQLTDIIDISTSSTHSLFCTASGKVFGVGEGFAGAFGKYNYSYSTPTLLPIRNIKRVSAGDRGSMFVTIDGRVIFTGIDFMEEYKTDFGEFENLKNVHIGSISCGPYHTVMLEAVSHPVFNKCDWKKIFVNYDVLINCKECTL